MKLKSNCFNHFDRESVGICKLCNKAFCRECISFYEEKLSCSACIVVKLKESKKRTHSKGQIGFFVLFFLFLVLGMAFFIVLGNFLTSLAPVAE